MISLILEYGFVTNQTKPHGKSGIWAKIDEGEGILKSVKWVSRYLETKSFQ